MIDKKDVLSIVREKGPVLPRDIVKELGGDTFFTGAILSQLVDKKEIKISHAVEKIELNHLGAKFS